MVIQSADLFFQEGSSDKEYHTQIIDEGNDQFQVACQWGRRGSSLQSAVKCQGVSKGKAQQVYDKIVAEKLGKGYQAATKVVSATTTTPAYTQAPTAKVVNAAFIPQLLNSIEDSEVERYLKDDFFVCQEKKDGKHIMLMFCQGVLTAYNRKGQEVSCPAEWAKAFKTDAVLDGEAIGDTYHVFDVLESGEKDLRKLGYTERIAEVIFVTDPSVDCVRVVPVHVGYAEKKALYDRLWAECREGIVFKKYTAPYVSGRPASGGSMLKNKFTATASVLVTQGRDGKHSVGMQVLDGDSWIDVGNVTIPTLTALPSVGSVIEVRYLYAFKGGSLFQPTYLGVRDDIDPNECVITQLKYKAED